jgi:hypothetical protein
MSFQNTVQSTSKLYLADEIVYIASYSTGMANDSYASLTGASWTNLGALSEFSREPKIDASTPPSQNVEHETVITRMAETINLTVQELTQANYNKLMGGSAQAVSISGSSTAIIESYSTGTLSTAVISFHKFTQQNWSTTSATIPISPTGIVIGGSSTYVLGVSYDVIQNEIFEWGFVVVSTGGITSSAAITVNYSYTPKSASVLYHGGADNLTPYMMKVYSVYSDGRALLTYYPYCNYMSGGAVSDKAGGKGEYKDMKFTIEAKEHPTYTYLNRKQFRIDIQTTA